MGKMLVETTGETNPKEKSHAWKVQHSSANSTWGTPKHVFEALDQDFGIDLDAAATKASRLCSHYYGPDHKDPARRDALSEKWALSAGSAPSAVFVNPPYGRNLTNKRVEAACRNSRESTVVALVMACTETAWWREWAWKADEIRLVQSRIRFIDPETGLSAGSAPTGSAIIVFRPYVPVDGWPGGPRIVLWEQPNPNT